MELQQSLWGETHLFTAGLPYASVSFPLESQQGGINSTSLDGRPVEDITPDFAKRMYRADGPETSKAAALKTLPKSGSQKEEVLAAFKARYPQGYIDEELIAACTLKNDNARKRRVDLVSDGWVKDSGEKRLTSSKCESIVWILA